MLLDFQMSWNFQTVERSNTLDRLAVPSHSCPPPSKAEIRSGLQPVLSETPEARHGPLTRAWLAA